MDFYVDVFPIAMKILVRCKDAHTISGGRRAYQKIGMGSLDSVFPAYV
jgi:hypothetical protein